ncbi:NAD(P)/FAD-dependent oxidoreductase [Amycolatopsis pigmentata]|uniref:NAD(P)/FAD-dependent oxidoreductase n=1 Tax=Amycolatopsis pigmentata TaxID=450801 RepID=A0ABW5FNB0_9PSEU
MRRGIAVVGAGLAGLRAAVTLRTEGFDGHLTILGAEPHRPYDRPPLSKGLLDGTVATEDLTLFEPDDLAAEWLLGDPVIGLDLIDRAITTASGGRVTFDGLVIATGSTNRRLPNCPSGLPGMWSLRTLDEAQALRDALRTGTRLIVVGAGLVAMEVASAANALGAAVEIVTVDPPLARFGEAIAHACADKLAECGVRVRTGRRVVRTDSSGGSVTVSLDDGSVLTADVLLVAIGAVPETGWLKDSGIPIEGGVSCDETLAVRGVSGVVAAGDVVRWPHPLFGGRPVQIGHWSNAVEQGAAAARTLLNGPDRAVPFAAVPSFWSDHWGTRLNGLGIAALADRHEIVAGERSLIVAGYRGERLVSATGYGGARLLAPYRAQLVRQAGRLEVTR